MKALSSIKVSLATASVILCWAYSPTGIHIGLENYSPGHLALLRFLIASLFMAGVALAKGIALPRLRDLPWLFVLGFFAIFLHHVSINYGQQWVTPGAGSVLAQSTPLFSTLIAYFWLRESVSGWRWLGVLAGFVGVLVVIWGDRGIGTFNPQGFLIVLAALSWSIYFALQKHYAHHYDGLTTVCYMVWAGTLLLCVYLPGLGQAVTQASLRVNVAVLVLGIFPSALAYLAWAYVLTHSAVSRSAVALYLIPPVAIVMAALVLRVGVSPMVLLGGAIVLGSVLALQLEGRKGDTIRGGSVPRQASPHRGEGARGMASEELVPQVRPRGADLK
ncbi:DMT family transporter [Pseudomonas asplenii]|uniref:DMT family transporter n=1 Tax=Pseudomonas asplenii TaxID=53407 RepID=UPI0006B5C00B|nr:DMT family transporter [Pseudomonas fuscovaginae]KPA99213.1 DMT(drug/metabolite transporter) superfamily permease [Pseudomonas fuscovaginae]